MTSPARHDAKTSRLDIHERRASRRRMIRARTAVEILDHLFKTDPVAAQAYMDHQFERYMAGA